MRAPSHATLQVLQNLDVWDEKVGFVSLGKFAPAGAVLLWPQMRFSQVPSTLLKSKLSHPSCALLYSLHKKVELRDRPLAAEARLRDSMRSHFGKERCYMIFRNGGCVWGGNGEGRRARAHAHLIKERAMRVYTKRGI